VAEFNAYLDDEDADPLGDLVGYRQHGVWLSRDELLQLIEGMRAAILPVLGNEATSDRKRYLLSPILFPVEDPGDGGSCHISWPGYVTSTYLRRTRRS